MTDPKLDTCGCCKADIASPSHQNQPGLSQLRYRIGTHPIFLERMKARIHKWAVRDGEFIGKRSLAELATRAGDDPAIALMDAWAAVADVLTFYQERIANEGFLRTATERRSIVDLARAIGYELNPGVAAATYVAFTMDDAKGTPLTSTVPAGTQVQSIPAKQGELPQTFETKEAFVARRAWNALKPRLHHPQMLSSTMPHAYLDGIDTHLRAGDLVLLIISGTPYPKKILSVEVEAKAKHTRIDFARDLDPPSTMLTPPSEEVLDLTQEKLDLTAANVDTYIFKKCWKEGDFQAFLTLHGWDENEVLAYIAQLRDGLFKKDNRQLLALREQMGVFGHNAPRFESLPEKDDASNPSSSVKKSSAGTAIEKEAVYPAAGKAVEKKVVYPAAMVSPCTSTKQWPQDWDCLDLSIWKDSLTNDYYDQPADEYYDVYLEQAVSDLAPGSWAVFERPKRPDNQFISYLIADVAVVSRVGFGMSTKVTGLDLTDKDGTPLANTSSDKPNGFKFRTSRAYLKSEVLDLAPIPITKGLKAGDTELWLGTMAVGFKKKQMVALTGEEVDTNGQLRSEMLKLKEIIHSGGYTRLSFDKGLAYSYKRNTVAINANVVLADHGETVANEVLGSGDGAAEHQCFELKKSPLTYISAATASGSESTLSVRVDSVEWTQVSSLYGLDANSKKHIVRIDNDAKAHVIFGDGKRGARLTTGQENITAIYRCGIGSDGEVGADRLTLLKTRPFGIRSVTNPLKASGADDPETLDDARDNAPLTVLTLDRIVSVQDYEDFARAFAGIGKAQAMTVWDGEAERVHVTVADANGDAVVDPLYGKLLDAIENARDPLREVRLDSFKPFVFFLSAAVLIEKAYEWEDVKIKTEQALLDTFCFKKRAFAQPVTAAEVVKVIHDVAGVKAVDLNELYKTEIDAAGPPGNLFNTVLDVQPARYDKDKDKILPAQLLLIHELGIALSEMTP